MRLIVSTMKDEGPFILEWIAYYLFLGFDHFIINTNDCSDGTDKIIARLEELGIASHIDNPGPWKLGPQASAYANAMAHPKFKEAEWVMVCDADEFLDIKVGDRTLDALFDAAPHANVFAFAWRLFGHSKVVDFEDKFITEQMVWAAKPQQVMPQQTRALKSLYRNNGVYRFVSTHRPKKARPNRIREIRWADGAGDPMPGYERQGWAFCLNGIGYGDSLARMNHYAVRSLSSYLMKRMRGDVNTTSFHGKMESSGETYWRLHCWNAIAETSILDTVPAVKEIYDRLRADPVLGALHDEAVAFHKDRITALRKTPQANDFISKFADFGHDRIVQVKDLVLSDPNAAFEAADFDAKLFLRWMQVTRYQETRTRLLVGTLPWFANCDALETPVSQAEVQSVLSTFLTPDTGGYETLPPLPKSLLDKIDQPRPALSPRQMRLRRRRGAFLKEIANKKQKTWLLVGGRRFELIDDLLALDRLETLYVIDPWGMRDAEFAINIAAHNVSEARRERDAEFFAMVMQYAEQIKSGRFRICRAQPGSVLKLFEDNFFDVAFLNGSRTPQRAAVILELLAQKTKPGGMLVTNSYEQDALAHGMHKFLGRDCYAGARRISAINKQYLAVEV
ncbi:glycosyltransferase family 2 protein [Loktanella agnita]|uniref:glycosyltransferase family 2 protein n=1 Tax=Loktanella agnita TaxID=287097 RepID=UPI0039899AA1